MQANTAWSCQPEATAFLHDCLDELLKNSLYLRELKDKLFNDTSTFLFDWIDHFLLPATESIEKQVQKLGFQEVYTTSRYRVFNAYQAKLPFVVLDTTFSGQEKGIAITCDDCTDALFMQHIVRRIEGETVFRYICVEKNKEVDIRICERKGVYPYSTQLGTQKKYEEAFLLWKTRSRRALQGEEEILLNEAKLRAQKMVELVGKGTAASIICTIERQYWQNRNQAGALQKSRQDRFGLGWANHDHHTFRSSRTHFHSLVELFEIVGFVCREHFYAGKEAGWGAQVMEHYEAHLVLFLDVDLAEHEIAIDFAHNRLEPRQTLGTIGLWCALHGESILQAGMHHLEAQFAFEKLRDDLQQQGISMMTPFTNLSYLRQAFTKGERWSVDPIRLDTLYKSKQITYDQKERFLKEGSIGSHLENLERKDGYKGFHQKGVSAIIKETDPRAHS